MKNGCANRTKSRACSSYAEVKPAIEEVNEKLPMRLEINHCIIHDVLPDPVGGGG